jgi:hypothetical protein
MFHLVGSGIQTGNLSVNGLMVLTVVNLLPNFGGVEECLYVVSKSSTVQESQHGPSLEEERG